MGDARRFGVWHPARYAPVRGALPVLSRESGALSSNAARNGQTVIDQSFLELIEAEIKTRQHTQFRRFAQYRNDPVGFVEQALLGFLWSKQKEVALSVLNNRRTAVKSCHGSGKSYVASRIASWWTSCHEPGDAFLVSIAPTFHQVKAILWREIQKAHSAGGLPGTLNQTEWKIGSELVGYGRSPDNMTNIQGIHAARVLVIGDEACGLRKDILDGVDSLLTNDDCRILLIGNPDDPTTEFANVCKPGSGWNVITISAFDSPNFTGEAVPDRIRPLLISKVWAGEKLASWGASSPLYQAKILGEFPEQASDSLIPIPAIKAAQARFETAPTEGPNDLGVDVARMGDDASVFYRRKGWKAYCEHRHNKKDLMELVGHVVRICALDKPNRIKIDDTGMGGGVTDRLREIQNSQDPGDNAARVALEGVEIIPINAGESPSSDKSDERFKNKRGEMNWKMREFFTAADAKIGLDANDDLLSQATQIKYKVQSTGEIVIEKKVDMKKRTKGKSPDDWDALVLAFAEPTFEGSGILDYYKAMAAKLAGPKRIDGPPTDANGGVRLVAPIDDNGEPAFSTVYGMSGKMYSVTGGQIVVIPEDVQPLLGQGFTRPV